jgi:hypothetical protein
MGPADFAPLYVASEFSKGHRMAQTENPLMSRKVLCFHRDLAATQDEQALFSTIVGQTLLRSNAAGPARYRPNDPTSLEEVDCVFAAPGATIDQAYLDAGVPVLTL